MSYAQAQRIPESDAHYFTEEAERKLVARCHKVFFALGWQHPFFYPAISYLTFCGGPVGTACVRLDGQITIDPRFAETLSDAELAGVIAHEVSHLLYLHFVRRGNREHARWNKAGDRALNAILEEAGIQLPRGALFPVANDQWTWSAEDLYNVEPESPAGGGGGEGRPQVGQGCGVDPAPKGGQGDSDDDQDGAGGAGDDDQDGDQDGQGGGKDGDQDGQSGPGGDGQDGDGDGQDGQDGEGSGADGAGENTERQVGKPSGQTQIPDWGYIAAQCAASAQNGSGASGKVLRRLALSPPTRVRWESILRRAVNQAIMAHGRDDNTWQRRSRRSQLHGPLYPGHTAYKTRVCVVIDTSGSMGHKAIADAISNTVKIARVSGCRIFLVGHTCDAYYSGWLQGRMASAPELEKFLGQSGGTSFVDAFNVVERERAKFDAIVQLTDGECHWPNPPKPRNCRRHIIALLGMSCRSYAPQTAEVIEASID